MADFKLSANIEVRKQAPLDDRLAKMTKADLVKPESWASDNGTYYVYKYMIVGTADGAFMLTDVDKLLSADFSGWKRIGNESTSTGGLTEEEVRDLLDIVLSGYVQKEEGKGLSSNDYTSEDKEKLDGLQNYDDSQIVGQLASLQSDLNMLVSGDATKAIASFNEIVAFLANIEDTQTLEGILNSISQTIAAVEAKIPTVPTMVSELVNDMGYITLDEVPQQDLSGYAKKEDIPTDYLKEVPEEYVTETELEDRLKTFIPEGGINNGVSEARVQQMIDVETQRASEAEQDLSDAIAEVDGKIPTKTSQLENDSKFLTEHQSLEHLATKDELTEYAKKSDIPTDYLTEVPEEYVTSEELEERLAGFTPGTGGGGTGGGATDAQVQALQAAINAEVERAKGVEELLTQRITEETTNSNAAYTSIDNKFTKMVGDEEARAIQAEAELSERIEEVDGKIPTKTSQLENDSNFLTEHQSLEHLATKDELATKQDKIEDLDVIREGSQRAIPTKVSELENDKGYLTEHQDISHLVTRADIEGMAEDTAQAKANSEAALTQSNQAKVNADAALTTSDVAIESIKSLQGLSNADEAMVELAKQITQIAQNTSDIQILQQKHQTLTEEEFEALEAAGELKEGVFYYIYES